MCSAPTRAFTLIELITAVVIFAIASAVVVPRFVNWDERRAEAEVQGVADVLSSAARRHLFSTQRLLLEFGVDDAGVGRLRVLTLRLENPSSFDVGNARWLEDPLTPAAELEGLTLVSAAEGGKALDERRFGIEFPPAEPRQAVTLVLQSRVGPGRWTVHLPTGAERATVSPGQGQPGDDRTDLDDAGLRDEAW